MSATTDFGDDDAEATQLFGALLDICEIFAYQLEVAPSTGYRHYQGYLELVNKNRHTWIQNQLQRHSLHFEFLEGAKGTPIQAWAYSTKEETRASGPWTFGEPRHSEKANKSALFVAAIKSGATDSELCDSFPGMMCNSFGNALKIRQAFNIPVPDPERTHPLEVFLFYGPSGTGKSQFARQQAKLGGYLPYVLPIGKDFWLTPSMVGKNFVIIEDFKSNLSLKDLLNLLDVYPIEVPIKGGFTWWVPHIIVVTTNRSPHDWYAYNDRDDEKQAVFRRFTGGAYRFDKNRLGTPAPVEMDINDASKFMIARREPICASCDNKKSQCQCRGSPYRRLNIK